MSNLHILKHYILQKSKINKNKKIQVERKAVENSKMTVTVLLMHIY